MTIVMVKNPVEFSFTIWMNNHPDSTHWKDKERFYVFVKTVHRHNAKIWKDREYLRKKIIERKPNFDPEYLEYILQLYIELLDFNRTYPIYSGWKSCSDTSVNARDGYYIEKEAQNGQIISKELPIIF